MKKIALLLLAGSAFLYSCHKSDSSNNTTATVTEDQVMADFVSKLAVPQYQNLNSKATAFNNAITLLNTNTTDANLQAAKQSWKDLRQAWEQCEGFLFGPVEDDNYDPNMDTWPVDNVQLDSLLASGNTLALADVKNFSLSLRGFHPIEFILWGTSGNATADSITARQKTYMVSLGQDILDNTTALYNSWLPSAGNFSDTVLAAGKGSSRFGKKQDFFLAVAGGLTDICEEVGTGKMKEPFDAHDSLKSESPFSHSSLIDFRNNIIGAQNAYLCSYQSQSGASLSNLVSARNLSLDNKIKQKFTTAINSFDGVTTTFEQAIYTQRTQLTATMAAINDLQATLDAELKPYIQTYITD